MFNQQPANSPVSSKELAYISDSLKNEELIAKIAVQGVAESHSPQLKRQLAQIAQDRLQNTQQLLRMLQQHTQMSH